MARVFIGVGHGGTDPGAVGYLVEKDVNLKMARACYDYLQARGIDTRISRTGDVTDKLVSKIDRCNAFAPDLALDIHNNAGGGDGFEIFHSVVGGKGKELAQNIEKEVVKIGLQDQTGPAWRLLRFRARHQVPSGHLRGCICR